MPGASESARLRVASERLSKAEPLGRKAMRNEMFGMCKGLRTTWGALHDTDSLVALLLSLQGQLAPWRAVGYMHNHNSSGAPN